MAGFGSRGAEPRGSGSEHLDVRPRCREARRVSASFFETPVINSPYALPQQHWELDANGLPTNRIIANRRRSDLITPVPKPKKQK